MRMGKNFVEICPSKYALCIAACGFLATSFLAPVCGEESKNQGTLVAAIARTYGSESFCDLSEVNFTFHAKSPDTKLERRWLWFPKTNDVIYTGTDVQGDKNTIEYSRNNLASLHQDFRTIDSWFVNDRYWLLFPLYLAMDTGITFTQKNSAVMPLCGKWATGLTVEYSSKIPGRPGDKFDFYLDSRNIVREWVRYPGEKARYIAASKWEEYKEFGAILISLNRPSQDPRDMRVWFTNVSFKKGN